MHRLPGGSRIAFRILTVRRQVARRREPRRNFHVLAIYFWAIIQAERLTAPAVTTPPERPASRAADQPAVARGCTQGVAAPHLVERPRP